MACGSVFASDRGRDLTSDLMTPPDLTSPPLSRSSFRAGGDVHEAVRFLQAEHEAVLRGLHQQMTILQQRCDDLQFEAHLRPLTVDEAAWRRRVAEATRQLEEREARVAQLEAQVGQREARCQQLEAQLGEAEDRCQALEGQLSTTEERCEQHCWQEVQLQQQVQAGEQRVADLRAEVSKLRAQVRDLRVYSCALRTVGGSNSSSRGGTARPTSRMLRPASRTSAGSQESLECAAGPRSLGSEDGDTAGGWWREARLQGARAPPPRPHASLPPALSPPPSLPPLASLPAAASRPSSGAVVLPPITGTARHVRRQMRLASAPTPAPPPGQRIDPVPQREPA